MDFNHAHSRIHTQNTDKFSDNEVVEQDLCFSTFVDYKVMPFDFFHIHQQTTHWSFIKKATFSGLLF